MEMKTLLAFVVGVVLGMPTWSHAAERVPLASLHVGLESAGWALPRADRAANGRPMQIKGKKYEKGLGAKAGSSYFIELGGSQRFTADVGLDDQTDEHPWRKAQFQVVVDGQIAFDSGLMMVGQPAQSVDLDVAGRKLLELRVIDHAYNFPPALVDWANATLLVDGVMPRAVPCPEPAVILTPKPGPQPRINGASVFGVRPGSPFLFTIAATGERPMRFAVEGLPAGLTLNAATGVISGQIAEHAAKTYRVTLKAKNARGEASRQLRIVVGERICLTPPMGWNSWNCYAATVDQEKVLATAQAMVHKGLKDHGWTYVNIDDAWQGQRGGQFRGILANEKFPDMKGLCDAVHSMGLKVGIYSTPWAMSYAKYIGGSSNDPSGTMSGGHEFGKYSFAKADARQWAAWGMDYLKYDWRPLDIEHVEEMSKALRACGRDIAYSLSNTALYDHAGQYARLTTCWRTTGDIRDLWDLGDRSGQAYPQGIRDIAAANAYWQPFAGPGHYNDPDMLVVGQVGWGKLRPTFLTPNEQYTHVSLWCLWAAPLLIGAPIDQLDDFTLNLLTNDEVLAVNQDPLCQQAARLAKYGSIEVWGKRLEDGSRAVGLFNFGFEETPFVLQLADLGTAGRWRIRDLWRQQDLATSDGAVRTTIARHGVVLLRLTPERAAK
jgi:alpha-galactosidase